MRIWKSHTLFSLVNGYLVDSPQPSNISYLWNFGSLFGYCSIIQIVTGVTLVAMHWNPSVLDVLEASNAVEQILMDVNNGWLRYSHSDTYTHTYMCFFGFVPAGRGSYNGWYKVRRALVWTMGTFILVLMIATAFLLYDLLPVVRNFFSLDYNSVLEAFNNIKLAFNEFSNLAVEHIIRNGVKYISIFTLGFLCSAYSEVALHFRSNKDPRALVFNIGTGLSRLITAYGLVLILFLPLFYGGFTYATILLFFKTSLLCIRLRNNYASTLLCEKNAFSTKLDGYLYNSSKPIIFMCAMLYSCIQIMPIILMGMLLWYNQLNIEAMPALIIVEGNIIYYVKLSYMTLVPEFEARSADGAWFLAKMRILGPPHEYRRANGQVIMREVLLCRPEVRACLDTNIWPRFGGDTHMYAAMLVNLFK